MQISKELELCFQFFNNIGIEFEIYDEKIESFLPGIEILEGKLFVNIENLLYPGDILHEAGHIAIVPKAERKTLNAKILGKRPSKEAEEMMAIAWSYAACYHLGLHFEFVFHENGYKGGGKYIIQNFAEKHYIGLPMLQYHGFCFDEKNAKINNEKPYPYMKKWILE